jgi:4'-phosphopantetheinyl transferase
MIVPQWPEPPPKTDLSRGEVHLWAVALDPQDDFLQPCENLLSEGERNRAARFRAGFLRNRYVTARGALRLLLGRYLQAEPAEIAISHQPHGKPELTAPWNRHGVEFNLSHSGDLAIIAVTRGCPIGVDVEAIRQMPNAEALLQRFFSPEEVAQWRQCPEERREAVFFQGWTRKEAWLKAVGSGLSFPLDEFCVTMDGAARMLSIQGDTVEASKWQLDCFEPCLGYIGAVAVRGRIESMPQWRFVS